jgi:hypothetical protein
MRAHIVFGVLSAVVSLVGCAGTTPEEVGQNEDKIVAWLVSPTNFKDDNLVGTWVPAEPGNFRPGEDKPIHFSKVDGDRLYKLGEACTTPECVQNGNWNIDRHFVSTMVRGTRVETRSTLHPGNEKSLFVWGMASGEVRLVDLDTCDFLLFNCDHTWTKTPKLNVWEL